MKKIFFNFILSIITFNVYAQLPDCAGADSNCVFLHGSNEIYRYDPNQPLSATNPSVFLTSATMPWGGLTISYNLNGGAASPTFYSTDGGTYSYWDGANWVNTGHTAATVNLGGGMATIYGKNGGTGYLSKYTGTGNDVFFANGLGNSGPYDLVTDNQDNLYEVDISGTIGYIYKYNTTGVIVDTFVILNPPSQTAGPGFAMIGNKIYLGVNTTPGLWSGTLINDTATVTAVGSFGLSYGDFANCPSLISSNPSASLVYNSCNGPINIAISSPLLTGTPTYSWNFGDPASGINNTSTIANVTHVFSGPGTYTVTLIITNGGLTDTITNIAIVDVHKTTTVDTTICYGLTFDGYTASGTYVDSFLSAAGCDSVRTLNLTIRPKLETFLSADICSTGSFEGYNQTGNYTDVFTSLVTGCDSIRYINLTVHQNPEVELSFPDEDICKDDYVQIQATGADSYKWYLNSSVTPVSTTNNYNLQVKDHEFLLVEGFSTFGCKDVETKTFIYVPCCGHVFVPNAFSPNGDKKNDDFRVQVDRDLENYMLQIYDRWGQELFRSIDIKEGWNGKFKGKECEVDTYQYLLHIKCKESKVLKGDIMLVR